MSDSEVGRVVPNAPSGFPQRERLFHDTPPGVGAGEIFFVTICCTPRGKNQLATPTIFSAVRDAFVYYQQTGKAWTRLLLAMPDHLHVLAAFPPTERMDAVVRNLKRYLAKNAPIAWQDGFFDHRLRSHESLEEKARYIRLNPVRAGLVATPEEWPYVWPIRNVEAAR